MFRIQGNVLHSDSIGPAAILGIVLVAACSSSTPATNEAGATCTSPGQFTVGPPDDHCTLPDGGTMVQTVDPAACNAIPDSGGDDGGPPSCPYGSTMFSALPNQAVADDDDCKYHVTVTNLSPICQGAGGVAFQVVATRRTDNSALAGATIGAEVVTTALGDWDADTYCDTNGHGTPTDNGRFIPFAEGPTGTYTGSFVFDRSGQWTVRLHFFESCFDVPDSPHGHAAFHITVP